MILDVVYNHLGPGSEAITAFGPYLTDRHETFWGDALDFSRVRASASGRSRTRCMWVEDYGIDGLRLDAVHAIYDDSPRHVLAELADRVHAGAPRALVISETWSTTTGRSRSGGTTPAGRTGSTMRCTRC